MKSGMKGGWWQHVKLFTPEFLAGGAWGGPGWEISHGHCGSLLQEDGKASSPCAPVAQGFLLGFLLPCLSFLLQLFVWESSQFPIFRKGEEPSIHLFLPHKMDHGRRGFSFFLPSPVS